MKRLFCLQVAALPLLLPLTAVAGAADWSGSGPFATGLGNRVITALAVSADGRQVYAGSGSGTVFVHVLAPPSLGGSFLTDGAVTDNGTIAPFSGVSVADGDSANVSVHIIFTGANGTLSGTGLTLTGPGDYTVDAATPATVTTNLQGLTFTPTANQVAVGSTVVTDFTLTPNDGSQNGTSDGTTRVTATSINDAPTVSGVYDLGNTDEDQTSGAVLVSTILAGITYTDPDPGALQGIGVTAASGAGTWQYSTDNSNWTDFGSASDDSPLVLAGGTWVHFVPSANSNGSAGLTFRGWDQTNNTPSTFGAPHYGDYPATGGSHAYTAGTADASLSVNAVNDPPAFTETPAITGSPLEGQLLSLSETGTSDPDGNLVSLSYQWRADGGDITGATGATYRLTGGEVGKSVTCLLTGDDGQGQPNSATTVTTAGVLVAADSDGDGVADSLDLCPGYNDALDGDSDTIPDGCDNCPLISNSSQSDANGNGLGDACDSSSDTDNDGLNDSDEISASTDPANPDCDGDGFFDGQEVTAGTDPLDPLREPLPTRTVRHDFNGDGRRDLLWHRDDNGGNLVWLTGPDGASVTTSSWMGSLATKWRILDVSDFNGDGNADLLYRDDATGQQLVSLTSPDGTSNATKAWLGHQMLAASGWNYGATGDFNGDGRADILWHSDAEGYLVWFTGPTGLTVSDAHWLGYLNPVWTLLGSGDFNGDGKADLLCRNPTTGQQLVALTSSDGMAMASKKWLGAAMPVSGGWLFADIADFNGDGRDDLIWQRNGDGANLVWYLGADGVSVESTTQIGNLGNWWSLLGAGDFSGDGNADLLYRAEGNGQQLVYRTSADGHAMESKKMLGHLVPSSSGWSFVGKSASKK